MAQYIRMNTLTGAVIPGVVSQAPEVMEKGSLRWLTVVDNVLSAWQSNGSFPATVAVNATTISLAVVDATLADWKLRRVADIRREQYRRIEAAYPLGQVISTLFKSLRLTYKKAATGAVTVPEATYLSAVGTIASSTIEPIDTAAQAAVDAINAAANYLAVETAYAAVAWP